MAEPIKNETLENSALLRIEGYAASAVILPNGDVIVNGKVVVNARDNFVQVYPINQSVTVVMRAVSNDCTVAPRKLKQVGDMQKDGTVCLYVNSEKDVALFLPADIFGGKAGFYDQHIVVNKANAQFGLHGCKQWRLMTYSEIDTLRNIWSKVAPPALQGIDAPLFWSDQNYLRPSSGVALKGGYNGLIGNDVSDILPVPVVRSGPAWSLDI